MEMTHVCANGEHERCRATLEFQDPRDYEEMDERIFLCQCACHGGILGALLANYRRMARQDREERLVEDAPL